MKTAIAYIVIAICWSRFVSRRLWENKRRQMPSLFRHSGFTFTFCFHLPIQSAHTQQWTHTHTHTRSSGQLFVLRRPGSSWGFGGWVLLKGTSVVVSRVERVLYIHSVHLQFLPARDSNSQPLNYESDSLNIRPQLSLEEGHLYNYNEKPFHFWSCLI